eukprot:6467235-Amphidinium_carterae.2
MMIQQLRTVDQHRKVHCSEEPLHSLSEAHTRDWPHQQVQPASAQTHMVDLCDELKGTNFRPVANVHLFLWK